MAFLIRCYLLAIVLLVCTSCANSPYSAHNRGLMFHEDQLDQEAEMAFLEAIQIDSKNDESWNQLGIIAFERDDLDLAERRFQKAYQLNRLNAAYPRNLALVFAKRDKFDMAKQLINKSLTLNPIDPATHIAMGKICYLEGKTDQALESMRMALEIEPANEEALQLSSRLQSLAN